ncbi:hypothetical protein SAMD00023353_10400250 [Rosellinia necatrix]|uniref:Uncharacterized protein n=1 Tax=Rosellinia necatrix TaxID=77044 RepID=A0A1W2TWN0_ROSNE|nr:hypothetical protein SAMD00023353_10400250 [Rosellinia necatrix]
MTAQPPNTSEFSHGPPYTENRPGKRRAKDPPSYSSAKRRRVFEITSVPLWYQPPHPLSVNGLLQSHCRTRLYVHPLQWTAQHLELLGYRFVRRTNRELTNHRAQHQPQSELQLPSEATILDIAQDLRTPSVRDWKAATVTRFLKGCNVIHLDSSRLRFYFKGRTVTTVPTSSIFSHRSNTASLAYLDLKCVGSKRDKSIGLVMSRKLEGPVWRIKETQQRRLIPPNEAEDPYIAGVLIALAQGLQHEHQHQHQKQSADRPNECLKPVPMELDPAVLPRQTATDFEVRLLALARDAQSLYFYTASIPSISLDMLDKPSHYHNANVVLISYHIIPLYPRKNLVPTMQSIISSL